MSKSLKKLIDINRLREFKNKLVGVDSAYVQTGAVDQTVGGTKTFPKPIVGSVTGSSGSCTGNAATADKATKAEQDGNGNNIVASYVAAGSEVLTTDDIGAFMAACPSFIKSLTYNNTWTDVISMRHRNGSLDGGNYGTYIRSANMTAETNLLWNHQYGGEWQGERTIIDSANLADFANATTAGSATKLAAARTINGTAFNGTANITTASWGTARNITITDGTNTSTAVSVNGSANVSLTLPATIKATFVGNITGNVTGNCSGSSGSCTGNAATATRANSAASADTATNANYANSAGSANTANSATTATNATNAATATKLAAKRTIALSGAATGTATGFDGSGNITIPVTALAASAIRAQWYAAFPDGAEAHNAMWGGRDITAAFDAGTVSEHIADGTFKDIFPGDYVTKSVTISGETYDVTWIVADCDYWINKGDTAMTAHHVAIVPQQPIFNARMNSTNTTEGGYKGSEMYKNIIPACAAGIVNAFGSDHILTFRDGISNSVDTSHVSSGLPQVMGTPVWWGEWVSVQCNLMSEKMVYGAPVCAAGAMDNTMATRQMSAFRLSEKLINYNRQDWWFRDVAFSIDFARIDSHGVASTGDASYVLGVRPFALLK